MCLVYETFVYTTHSTYTCTHTCTCIHVLYMYVHVHVCTFSSKLINITGIK